MRSVVVVVLLSIAALASSAPVASAFNVVNFGLQSYRIDGVDNPTLTLNRGQTYTFNINANGHPFFIKTVQGSGLGNQYNVGVTGNGTQVGTLTFHVAAGAPNTLFYNCQFHSTMTGQINVVGSAVPGYGAIGIVALGAMAAGLGVVAMRRRMA